MFNYTPGFHRIGRYNIWVIRYASKTLRILLIWEAVVTKVGAMWPGAGLTGGRYDSKCLVNSVIDIFPKLSVKLQNSCISCLLSPDIIIEWQHYFQCIQTPVLDVQSSAIFERLNVMFCRRGFPRCQPPLQRKQLAVASGLHPMTWHTKNQWITPPIIHRQLCFSDVMSVNQSYQLWKNIKLSSQKIYFISGYYAIPEKVTLKHYIFNIHDLS